MEKLGNCDPAIKVLGYEAIDSLRNVRKTPKGSQGQRGLGANGQEWWCLKCLEALFVDLRERVWKHRPDGSTQYVHPLTSIQYWLIPDRRSIPQYDGIYYTLQSPQIHLIGKWQAVKTFDELRDRPAEGHFDLPEDPTDGPITLYLGRDGESFYLDRPTRDLRGVLADNRVCEADANEVRGYSLSEALRRLDKKEDRMVEEKWKPIMAERKRKAKEEPELEGQYVEGQLARTGSSEEQGVGVDSDESEEPRDLPPPIFEGQRRAMPIVYAGNDLPENIGKRKRSDLDQLQELARPSTFVPQASGLAPMRNARNTEKAVLSSSSSFDRQPSGPVSARFPQVHASQEADLHPPSIALTGFVPLPSAKRSSSDRANGLVFKISNTEEGTRANAKASKKPLTSGSKAGLAPSALPAAQRSQPLKFAPKPTSRLCNRKPRGEGVPSIEQEIRQPGTRGSHESRN